MSDLLLSAETGRMEGTRPSRRLRREGKIPAVVYGLDADPIAVSVAWPELRRCLTTDAGINALITLDIDGANHLSVVKDIQRHPTRDSPPCRFPPGHRGSADRGQRSGRLAG